jgi:pimeloyl-ACP methyl ester carboxylesterase
LTSRQGLLSWYAYAYQLPRIPEWFYLGVDGRGERLARMLTSGGQRSDLAARDAQNMTEPGAYTAALNWYRAAPWSGGTGDVVVPTLLVWSNRDSYILEQTARRSGKYVTGDFRFEVLAGSHWLPDEQPEAVSDLLVDWFARFS